MLRLPVTLLIPLIVAFSLIGVFLTSLNAFDLYLMLGLALAALWLRWYNFPLAPLLLGFILSGLVEENVRRTLVLAEAGWIELLDPATGILLFLLCGVCLWPLWQVFRRQTA